MPAPTSALPRFRQLGEFYGRVKKETGIEVRIVEGQVEARLSFIGGLLPFQNPA
jgi:exopolyphosphatase/pppGpp-phosphohydrolase